MRKFCVLMYANDTIAWWRCEEGKVTVEAASAEDAMRAAEEAFGGRATAAFPLEDSPPELYREPTPSAGFWTPERAARFVGLLRLSLEWNSETR